MVFFSASQPLKQDPPRLSQAMPSFKQGPRLSKKTRPSPLLLGVFLVEIVQYPFFCASCYMYLVHFKRCFHVQSFIKPHNNVHKYFCWLLVGRSQSNESSSASLYS